MPYNIDFPIANSENIETALGRRLETIRLSRNISRTELAKQAGVGISTLARLKRHHAGVSFDSFIRIMIALDLAHHLQELLPDPEESPLWQHQQRSEPKRQRAWGSVKEQNTAPTKSQWAPNAVREWEGDYWPWHETKDSRG